MNYTNKYSFHVRRCLWRLFLLLIWAFASVAESGTFAERFFRADAPFPPEQYWEQLYCAAIGYSSMTAADESGIQLYKELFIKDAAASTNIVALLMAQPSSNTNQRALAIVMRTLLQGEDIDLADEVLEYCKNESNMYTYASPIQQAYHIGWKILNVESRNKFEETMLHKIMAYAPGPAGSTYAGGVTNCSNTMIQYLCLNAMLQTAGGCNIALAKELIQNIRQSAMDNPNEMRVTIRQSGGAIIVDAGILIDVMVQGQGRSCENREDIRSLLICEFESAIPIMSAAITCKEKLKYYFGTSRWFCDRSYPSRAGRHDERMEKAGQNWSKYFEETNYYALSQIMDWALFNKSELAPTILDTVLAGPSKDDAAKISCFAKYTSDSIQDAVRFARFYAFLAQSVIDQKPAMGSQQFKPLSLSERERITSLLKSLGDGMQYYNK